MQELARNGAAIVMVSSELLEVIHMSDRIAVVYGGRIVKTLDRSEATEEEVMSHALGLGHRPPERRPEA